MVTHDLEQCRVVEPHAPQRCHTFPDILIDQTRLVLGEAAGAVQDVVGHGLLADILKVSRQQGLFLEIFV